MWNLINYVVGIALVIFLLKSGFVDAVLTEIEIKIRKIKFDLFN
jgi:hypothetical protein